MESLFLSAIARVALATTDKVHLIFLRVKPLGRGSIISIELRRHKGCSVKLLDGCEVRPGDNVIKLHFNNAWIAQKLQLNSGTRTIGFPRGIVHYVKDGLQVLASEVADGKYGNISAVYGWTVFHAPASELGFQVIELPRNLRTRMAQFYITGLMHVNHVVWLKRHRAARKSLIVKAVWLSRAGLLRMYHFHS
jgi:peptidoglycan-N-acetylglucosamine deacetylase